MKYAGKSYDGVFKETSSRNSYSLGRNEKIVQKCSFGLPFLLSYNQQLEKIMILVQTLTNTHQLHCNTRLSTGRAEDCPPVEEVRGDQCCLTGCVCFYQHQMNRVTYRQHCSAICHPTAFSYRSKRNKIIQNNIYRSDSIIKYNNRKNKYTESL